MSIYDGCVEALIVSVATKPLQILQAVHHTLIISLILIEPEAKLYQIVTDVVFDVFC